MKIILVLLLLLLIGNAVQAGPVSQETAKKNAVKFLESRSARRRTVSAGELSLAHKLVNGKTGHESFYVFNRSGNNGFVVASGSDLTSPIIAYSDNGCFQPDSMPEPVDNWLQGIAEQIYRAEGMALPFKGRRQPEDIVSPLISTRWYQIGPYNLRCPVIGGYNCLTGCVATAMAQVLNYYQWPQNPVPFIEEYTTDHGIRVDALEPTTFKWDKMKPAYAYNETGEEADAVAELMRYCGQSVKMDYSLSSSAASLSPEALTRYFDYSQTVRSVSRNNYNTLQWEQLILNELKAGRPVIYSAGDHTYICDGYDGNGYFHINWGWGGKSDGYYLLSILNPDEDSNAGEPGGNGYNLWQHAMIGIQPNHGEGRICEVYMLDKWLTVPESPYTRERNDVFKDVELSGGVIDYGGDAIIDHAWILFKDEAQLDILSVKSDIDLTKSTPTSVYAKIDFGSGLADGEYYIRQCYRSGQEQEWSYCLGALSTFYIATVKGEKLTLSTSLNVETPIRINDVSISGDFRVNRTMTLTANITNLGYEGEQPLFLWMGPDKSLVGKTEANLSHGESTDLKIFFIPEDDGEQTLALTGTRGGMDTLWTGSVLIHPMPPQNLKGNIEISGMKNGAIEDTEIVATISLNNIGENDYDDKIQILVYPFNDDGEMELEPLLKKFIPTKIPVGETAQEVIRIDGLDKGRQYRIRIAYYDQDAWKEAASCYCKVGVLLEPSVLNIDIVARNANERNEVEGGDVSFDLSIENKGKYEYDNTIDFMVWDNTDGNPVWQEQSQHFKVKVDAGETVHCPVIIKGLEVGHRYLFGAYYYSIEVWTQGATYSCTILENTGTAVVADVNGDNIVNAQDIVEVVKCMMGNPSGTINQTNADVNGDSMVNIADIEAIVNVIMGN